jgi:hypothetical protein
MPRPEFLSWQTFYQLFPFDDLHRYHRPAALIAGSLGGGDLNARLNWLQPDPVAADWDEADLRTIAAFGFKPPMKD